MTASGFNAKPHKTGTKKAVIFVVQNNKDGFISYLGKLKNSGLGQIGNFFGGGIWGGLLTSTENLENFGNSWGGQGPNWGGTDFPKFFWGGPSLVILGVLPRYDFAISSSHVVRFC